MSAQQARPIARDKLPAPAPIRLDPALVLDAPRWLPIAECVLESYATRWDWHCWPGDRKIIERAIKDGKLATAQKRDPDSGRMVLLVKRTVAEQ